MKATAFRRDLEASRMFIAHKDHQFPIPRELCEPNTTHWRSVHLSTGAAWYALTIRIMSPIAPGGEEEIELQQTFLLSWDTDVADALKEVGSQTIELLCIAQGRGRRSTVWVTHRIAEVWRAIDDDGNSSVVFVCDNGAEISGLLAEPSHGQKKAELVARIRPSTARSRSLQ